jgi:hypothetical protein
VRCCLVPAQLVAAAAAAPKHSDRHEAFDAGRRAGFGRKAPPRPVPPQADLAPYVERDHQSTIAYELDKAAFMPGHSWIEDRLAVMFECRQVPASSMAIMGE